MCIVGDYGIALVQICANNMRLIGLVIKNKPCSMQKPFLSGQKTGEFKLVLEEVGEGNSGDFTDIVGRKDPFAEGVNLLHSVKGNQGIDSMGIDLSKELFDMGNSCCVKIGILPKQIYVYDRRIKIRSQWANSLASLSGCSTISAMKWDTATDIATNPWSLRSWLLASLAFFVVFTMSSFLSFAACSFVNFRVMHTG